MNIRATRKKITARQIDQDPQNKIGRSLWIVAHAARRIKKVAAPVWIISEGKRAIPPLGLPINTLPSRAPRENAR